MDHIFQSKEWYEHRRDIVQPRNKALEYFGERRWKRGTDRKENLYEECCDKELEYACNNHERLEMINQKWFPDWNVLNKYLR